MQVDPVALNNAHFVVMRSNPEIRGINGLLKMPPYLRIVWYDVYKDQAFSERISFDAAKALAPDKFAEAMSVLESHRKMSPTIGWQEAPPVPTINEDDAAEDARHASYVIPAKAKKPKRK